MSGGEQQMVALAKALLPEPRLLVIDELSLGLAPVVVQRILGVVEALHEAGTSLLVVEQSLNVASAFADRAVFLERGHVRRSEEHTSELQSLMRISYAVFCLKKTP